MTYPSMVLLFDWHLCKNRTFLLQRFIDSFEWKFILTRWEWPKSEDLNDFLYSFVSIKNKSKIEYFRENKPEYVGICKKIVELGLNSRIFLANRFVRHTAILINYETHDHPICICNSVDIYVKIRIFLC